MGNGDKKKSSDGDKKKSSEPAVFKPRTSFMWGPKSIEAINRDDDSVNLIKLTKAQVEAEIELGVGSGRGGKKIRPNSPVLNHCDLVSADKQVTKDLADFMPKKEK